MFNYSKKLTTLLDLLNKRTTIIRPIILLLIKPKNLFKIGIKHNHIKVINPGCNYPIKIKEEAKVFAQKIYKDASPKLITVSRLDGRKSHKNILMTIKNLLPKFPKLKYISIGDGDERNNLANLKKELNLNYEIVFLYKTSEQEKLGLLEKSDLFIMPSVIIKINWGSVFLY